MTAATDTTETPATTGTAGTTDHRSTRDRDPDAGTPGTGVTDGHATPARAGTPPGTGPTTTTLYSDELTCPSCVPKIEKRLRALAGVERGTVHFGSGRIEVLHAPETTVDELVDAVRDAGYHAAPRGF